MADPVFPSNSPITLDQIQQDLAASPAQSPVQSALDAFMPVQSPAVAAATAQVPPARPPLLDEKKKALADMADAKKLLLGGANGADDVYAVGARNGNNLVQENQVLKDIRDLSPLLLEQKYGSDIRYLANQATGAEQRLEDRLQESRTGGEILGDTLNSGAKAFIGTAGNIAAFGGGLVHDRVGSAISNVLDDINKGMDANSSDELTRRRQTASIAESLDSSDNLDQYVKDLETDGEVKAGLKRVGRDIGDSIARSGTDPMLFGDIAANAVGSLLVGGPISKTLTKAGKAATTGLKPVLRETGKKFVDDAIDLSAWPAAVGLMEGGGAYVQASQAVMSMTHPQLMANSPEYRQLIEQNVDKDEAKRRIANLAGVDAGVRQTGVGAATGLLTRFEATPFRVPTAAQGFRNARNEILEEGTQGGTGQLNVNAALQKYADNTGDPMQGVGAGIGEGVLGAIGASVATQGPGIVGRGAAAAVTIPTNAILDTLKDRGQKVEAANEAASPVAREKLRAEVDEALNKVPDIAQSLRATVTEQPAEVKAETENFIKKLAATAMMDPAEELADLPESIRSRIDVNNNNRFDAIWDVALVAADPNNDIDDRISAGLFVREQLATNRNMIESDLPAALQQALETNDPIRQELESYLKKIDIINQDADVKALMQQLDELIPLPEVSVDGLTPQIVANTVGLAAVNPAVVNPVTVTNILQQADEGKVELTPEQRKNLLATSTLVRGVEQYADDMAKMGQPLAKEITPELMQKVSNQLLVQSDDPSKQSLNQHVAGINKAMRDSDPILARELAVKLLKLAKHMKHKVEALNRSRAKGGSREGYRAVDPAGVWYDSTDKMQVHEKNANSVKFAQRVFAEASAAMTLANNIASIFPELKLPMQPMPELDAVLREPVSQAQHQVRTTTQQVENREFEADNRVVEAPVLEAETQPEPAKSRITEEQVRKLSDNGLMERIERLQDALLDGRDEAAKAEDQATFEVLNDELSRREDAYVEEAKEETVNAETDPQIRPEAEPEASEEVAEPVVAEADSETEAAETVRTDTRTEAEPVEAGTVADEVTETVEETEDEVIEIEAGPDTSTVEARYPKLMSGIKGIRNWFFQAFKFPETVKSRLVGVTDPVAFVKDAVSHATNLRDVVGSPLNYSFTDDHATDYERLLRGVEPIAKFIEGMLQKALNDPKNPQLKRLLADEALYQELRGRAYNLTERDAANVPHYNTELLHQAVLAGFSWLLNAERVKYDKDRDDLARELKVPVEDIDQEMVDFFNRGISFTDAARDLADVIQDYWGVSPNKAVKDGFVKGIPEAMAKEVLRGLEEAGMLVIDPVGWMIGKKKFPRVYFDTKTDTEQGRSEAMQSFLGRLKEVPSVLDDIVLPDNKKRPMIGIVPGDEYIEDTQLRNPDARLKPQQKAMLKAENSKPYFANMLMFNLLGSLGKAESMKLFGAVNVTQAEEKLYNKQDLRSIDGKNRSLENAYRTMMLQLAQIKNVVAAQTGDEKKSVETMPVFFLNSVAKSGRLQMHGGVTPVNDKLARELLMAAHSVLDMTDKADHDRFWVGVAQALGEKTENEYREDSVAAAQAIVAKGKDTFMPALEAHVRDGAKIPAEALKAIQAALGGDFSPKAMHALLSVAQLNTSTDKSRFETRLTLEADGKTDGVINAMINFTSGLFTPEWLKNVAKGGLFVGADGMTLNAHTKTVDGKDTYREIADDLQGRQMEMLATMPTDVRMSFNAMMTLMRKFMPKAFQVDPLSGELVFSRSLPKSPAMISVYGSGAKGIAGNLTMEIIDAFYSHLSELLQSGQKLDPEIEAALVELTQSSVKQSLVKGKLVWSRDEDDQRPLNSDYHSFKFGKAELDTMRGNIQQMLVRNLRESIMTTIGPAMQTVSRVQKAVQVQSLVRKYLYQDQFFKTLANEPVKKDWLSEKQKQEINKKLRRFSPIIDTGTQTFALGSRTSSNLTEDKPFSTTVDEQLATLAHNYVPEDAGVSAGPLLVIGSGDAQTVQNIITMQDPISGALYVFDGIEMKLKTIDEDAVKINQGAYDAWMRNPLKPVATSFSAFLRQNPFTEMDFMDAKFAKAMRADIMKSLWGESRAAKETWESTLDAINRLSAQLNQEADELDARKAVLARTPLSVDHFASAEAPFVRKGEDLLVLPEDPDEMLDVLNAEMQKELDRIQGRKAKTEVQQPTERVKERLSNRGYTDGQSGAQVVKLRELKGLIKGELFDKTMALLKGSDYQVVHGTPAQLRAHQEIYESGYDPKKSGAYGKIYFDTKTIYIANAAPETVLHELIHAATFGKVHAFFHNKESLSAEDQGAVERLFNLMQEWMGHSYDHESPVAQSAREQAFATVYRFYAKGQNAEAVNEFMAWSLTNQALADVQKQTKVANPLAKIVKDVLDTLKALFGLDKNPGDNLFANIRFNTEILLATPYDHLVDAQNVTLYQSPSFGSDKRLSNLREDFLDRITAPILALPKDEREPARREAQYQMDEGMEVARAFEKTGYLKTPQQASTFTMIHAALATELDLNPVSLSRLQDVYAGVIRDLKVEDLMENRNSKNPNDRFLAQAKFDVLTGVSIQKTDKFGRTNLLSSFLALAMVDPAFRKVLEGKKLPELDLDGAGTLDAKLSNLGTRLMDQLSKTLSGEGRDQPNVQAAIDALAAKLIAQKDDDRTFIEQAFDDKISKGERWLAEQLQAKSKAGYDAATKVANDPNANRFVKAAARAAQAVTMVINDDVGASAVSGITSALNRVNLWTPVRELFKELVGPTDETIPVDEMVSLVRSTVQKARQEFREDVPKIIAGEFSRPLTDVEWSRLHVGLGKTDLAELLLGNDTDTVLGMLKDEALAKVETARIEADLQASEGPLFDKIKRKADELAHFMVTGEAAGIQLYNAYAVANLHGVGGRKAGASPQLVQQVDHLVTLYALQKLDAETKQTLAELASSEKNGMSFSLNYLLGQRKDEIDKATTGLAKANQRKGYIPSENQLGANLIIADDSDYAALVGRSYERVGDYNGSRVEGRGIKRGYYYTGTSGRAPFQQGVLQTVRSSVNGVDPHTGLWMGLTGGAITDPVQVQRLIKRLHGNAKVNAENGEPLLPVWSEDGNIIAFQRGIDPRQQARMNQNTHMAQMVGAWRGRQVEELLSQHFNEQLIERLWSIWDEQKDARDVEFVDLANLARSDDPVLHEIWDLIPQQHKRKIEAAFGTDGFRVRKDMLPNAVGYRAASVADAWTGNTRWNENVQKAFRQAAMGVFDLVGKGNNAFKYLVNAEQFTQNAVTDAKYLIVVKSVVVPFANLMSNMLQLAGRGVPYRHILKGTASKTVEINQYIKNRHRQVELEANLRAASQDPAKALKIETELQSIYDANKRMTIWPLIKAGEFSAISEGGVTQEDLALAEGRFVQYVEKLTDKLPTSVKTLGRYAMVSRDTALFKGLARSVQYGDFIGKAILYEHRVKRMGMSPEQALRMISTEFVNYNFNSGRNRAYFESIGATWFWKYKLGSVRVARSMIVENPLRALTMNLIPHPELFGSIGAPITDNFIAKALDGGLAYSVGPEMGLNSVTLNPWINVAY